ncbi:hypothetical protein B9Z55_004692 [Caenorhabditis nigoni]|uniref:Uncharacterized protein n=1 Tax=Caenorhabditis nigoni TaxID=1611254 RepID=A0A2G5UXK3_9PELO|nr:hypothetical protein B9Z55_004692 [Caenorhabditis nigoni]
MSSADSSEPGERKAQSKRAQPNQNYYDHNAGAVPDQGQGQFVMPVVPPQGHGYQRYQQNQMQQQGYQQPYQKQYQYQPFGGYAQQDYGHLLHTLNQSYQYRGPPQPYMQNETVKFAQSSQPPMTAPAPAEKRENATRQDYDHQPPIIHKKQTPSTKDQLMELVRAMAHAIVGLQNQNAQLITEVGTLTNAFADLKKTMEGAPTTKETFAEMLNQCLSAPSAQVTIMNAAKSAKKSDYRQSSVIIRGAQLSTDSSQDNDLGRSVATECNISGNFSVFRISLKESPPLLKIQFKNKMDATKALVSFNSIKTRVTGCHSASIRPDLSKPELAKFRESWKEAIEKNNEAGQRIWTVRNLETIKIPYKDGQTPHPWIVRNQIE